MRLSRDLWDLSRRNMALPWHFLRSCKPVHCVLHLQGSCLPMLQLCKVVGFQGHSKVQETGLGAAKVRMLQTLLHQYNSCSWENIHEIVGNLQRTSRVLKGWFHPSLLVFVLIFWRERFTHTAFWRLCMRKITHIAMTPLINFLIYTWYNHQIMWL